MRTEKILEQSFLPILGRTVKKLDLFVTEKLQNAGLDLTKVQLILLFHLRQNDGMTQQAIASASSRDKASTARLLDNLEKKNLVARIPSKEDKRTNHIYLTKRGMEILTQAEPLLGNILEEVQVGMSESEINKMISWLEKVQSNINSNNIVA